MKKTLILLISAIILASCAHNRIKVKIENSLPFDRSAETVEIPLEIGRAHV